MLRGRSRRDRIRVQASRTRFRVMLALLVVTSAALMNYYVVREILVVLALLAAAFLTLLLFSVALLLSQEGLVWAVLWAKSGVTRFARFARLIPEAPDLAKTISEAKH